MTDEEQSSGPRVRISKGGELVREEALEAKHIAIGRSPTSRLVLDDPAVARTRHALISNKRGRYYIQADPKNSTTLEGRSIGGEGTVQLTSGNVIEIGPFTLQLLDLPSPSDAAPSGGELHRVLGSSKKTSRGRWIRNAEARLVAVIGGEAREWPVESEEVVLGRGEHVAVSIDHPSIEERHATIRFTGTDLTIGPVGGGPVEVDGRAVLDGDGGGGCELGEHAVVKLGDVEALFVRHRLDDDGVLRSDVPAARVVQELESRGLGIELPEEAASEPVDDLGVALVGEGKVAPADWAAAYRVAEEAWLAGQTFEPTKVVVEKTGSLAGGIVAAFVCAAIAVGSIVLARVLGGVMDKGSPFRELAGCGFACIVPGIAAVSALVFFSRSFASVARVPCPAGCGRVLRLGAGRALTRRCPCGRLVEAKEGVASVVAEDATVERPVLKVAVPEGGFRLPPVCCYCLAPCGTSMTVSDHVVEVDLAKNLAVGLATGGIIERSGGTRTTYRIQVPICEFCTGVDAVAIDASGDGKLTLGLRSRRFRTLFGLLNEVEPISTPLAVVDQEPAAAGGTVSGPSG